MNICYYCGPTNKELRPYGPGGSTVCFNCIKESPERTQAAKDAFSVLSEAVNVFGVSIIGTEEGLQ